MIAPTVVLFDPPKALTRARRTPTAKDIAAHLLAQAEAHPGMWVATIDLPASTVDRVKRHIRTTLGLPDGWEMRGFACNRQTWTRRVAVRTTADRHAVPDAPLPFDARRRWFAGVTA